MGKEAQRKLEKSRVNEFGIIYKFANKFAHDKRLCFYIFYPFLNSRTTPIFF